MTFLFKVAATMIVILVIVVAVWATGDIIAASQDNILPEINNG